MAGKSQAERFIAKLAEFGGAAGNGAMTVALGWSLETYDRVKAQLLAESKIVKRRGRGGGVALADTVEDLAVSRADVEDQVEPSSPVAELPARAEEATDPPAVTRVSARKDARDAEPRSLSGFIWSVAELLRGDYKPGDYGTVILPFTVLRRLDAVLAPTKAEVLAENAARTSQGVNPDPFLRRRAKQSFYNTSPMDLKALLGDPDNAAANLLSYVQAFSPEVRDIFERFEFATQIDRLARAKLLFQVTERFAGIDLHPHRVSQRRHGRRL